MAKKRNMDISEFLAEASNGVTGAKKRSSIPSVDGYGALADQAYEQYRAKKDAEAAFRAVEAELLEVSQKAYESHAGAGNFSKSFNIPGSSSPGVQISYKDQFEAFPLTRKAELQEKLGAKYDSFFEEKRVISVRVPDDETVEVLLTKLGPELFRKVFDIEMHIIPKADMDRRQWELPEDCRPKQYKGALKVLKSE